MDKPGQCLQRVPQQMLNRRGRWKAQAIFDQGPQVTGRVSYRVVELLDTVIHIPQPSSRLV